MSYAFVTFPSQMILAGFLSTCYGLYLAVNAPALVASDLAVSAPAVDPETVPVSPVLSNVGLLLPLHALGVAKSVAFFDQPCFFLSTA